MGAARAAGPLPFRLSCRAEKSEACADPRAALAALPMDALFGISIRCPEAEKIQRDKIISCPPLLPKQPYEAEAEFGMSAPDGQSWRVTYVHRAGWPEEVNLKRTMVFYH